jgi:hypothetical protein
LKIDVRKNKIHINESIRFIKYKQNGSWFIIRRRIINERSVIINFTKIVGNEIISIINEKTSDIKWDLRIERRKSIFC